MTALLPSAEAPFGLLQPVNDYIVTNATVLTWTNWPMLVVVPLMPMSLICYLVQFPNTRQWRIPIGLLGAAMVARGIFSYRFDDVELNAFNNGIGVAGLHLLVKYLEFGFLQGPIVDPYVARGSRSKIRASLDIASNSRMVGLGRIHLDNSTASKPNGNNPSNKLNGADGSVQVEGRIIPHNLERWLPYTTHPNRSRFRATVRHATHCFFHFFVFDTMLALLWKFGGSTIANASGTPNALQAFVDRTSFVLFPRAANPVPIPTLIVEIIVELSLAASIWQAISSAYHLLAALLVGSGLWEVESWEVDLFDAPWKADSILDLWGRRWHQIFRHHFLFLSTLTLKALHLPVTPSLMLPLVFVFSGAMHAFGQIGMKPIPNPTILATFFVLSGFGGALEAAFRRITGRRVRGPWGRLWTWAFMLHTGRIASRTWLDGGMGGNRFIPDGGFRPGVFVAKWATDWLFDAAMRK